MKKNLYLILGFIIGAVLTYYFCPRQIEESKPIGKIEKPKGVISVEEAKQLNDNWTNYRKKVVDSVVQRRGRKRDARSVYWDLEEVEQYLQYAKHYSDSLGYEMTGIRVYLGVYGKNSGPAKKNLTTMFIVPTGKKTDSKSSMNPFNFTEEPLVPPLNNGAGGEEPYNI